MRDRAQLVAVPGPRLRDEQHVRVIPLLPFCDLEVLARGLRHHRGSERPELLALLDQLVDVVSHLRVTRIAEDASVPERPRPEFQSPLRPCDDLSGREPLGRDADQPADVVVPLRRDVRSGGQRCLDGSFCQVGAPVRHCHPPSPLAASMRAMNMQRRTQSGSVVRGSRLDEHVVEHPAVGDEPVDRAVQGDAAGHAEPTRTRSLVEVLQYVEDHVLKTCLNRGRHVTVPVIYGATRFPPFSEQLDQRTQGSAMRFPFGPRVLGERWDLV